MAPLYEIGRVVARRRGRVRAEGIVDMAACILLIEHDRTLRDEITHGLWEAGFLVMGIASADEALDLLPLVTFDLVLEDIGTLRYCSGRASGLTALMQVLRNAPLQCFTTPATMGGDGSRGALVLEPPGRDVSVLLAAAQELLAHGAARSGLRTLN